MHKVLSLIIVFLLIYIFCCCCGSEHFDGAKKAGTLVTLHYTNWCPACKTMRPIWDAVKASVQKERSDIFFKENDEEATPTAGIRSYPTIVLLDPMGRSYTYFGPRDFYSLKNWILAPARLMT